MANIQDTAPAPAEAPTQDDAFASAFAERIGRDEKPASEDAAPKEEGTPPASEGDKSAEPDEAKAPFDPWNGLSEEQKGYFESLRHSESSNRGRVASLNRQLQEARAASQPPATEKKEEGTSQSEPADKDDRLARLKQAAEEYPDAVGPLVEAIVDLETRLEGSKPQAPATEQAPNEADMEREYQALEKAHPDYRQIGVDPSYANWVGTKSKAIQELANSYAADDVASVLTLYKAERTASMASIEPRQGGGAASDTTAQKRERQLEGSKAVQQRGGPTASGPASDDFHSAFAARAKGGR